MLMAVPMFHTWRTSAHVVTLQKWIRPSQGRGMHIRSKGWPRTCLWGACHIPTGVWGHRPGTVVLQNTTQANFEALCALRSQKMCSRGSIATGAFPVAPWSSSAATVPQLMLTRGGAGNHLFFAVISKRSGVSNIEQPTFHLCVEFLFSKGAFTAWRYAERGFSHGRKLVDPLRASTSDDVIVDEIPRFQMCVTSRYSGCIPRTQHVSSIFSAYVGGDCRVNRHLWTGHGVWDGRIAAPPPARTWTPFPALTLQRWNKRQRASCARPARRNVKKRARPVDVSAVISRCGS
eukprot:gene25067-biopygen16474